MNKSRVRRLNNIEFKGGNVVYWMSRDQRVENNPALIYAKEISQKHGLPFAVIFFLRKRLKDTHQGIFKFMLDGLKEVEKDLYKYNIPFYIFTENYQTKLLWFLEKFNIKLLIKDFTPLKGGVSRNRFLKDNLNISLYEVDAHNIVPVWEASDKQEYAAWTLRPKIHKKLDTYLTEYSELEKQELASSQFSINDNNWDSLSKYVKATDNPDFKNNFIAGTHNGYKVLQDFIDNKLNNYDESNDPNKKVVSNLSPYLHFGQISAQVVVREVNRATIDNKEAKEDFIEQLVVRRELAENYCFYNKDYDNFNGFPDWSKKTLNEHREDERIYTYGLEELEGLETHDNLWNSAQKDLCITGKMPGYLRMYWAKKILEWTQTPEQAQKFTIYLNDKYSLDGRDPNGYAGIAWSIGGVHDRAWAEREIYGKVRYMNKNGAKRKFDVEEYIKSVN